MADKNKDLVSMAQQFSGLPMKELIAAPLVAAAQANNMMTITQTQFLLNTCFDLVGSGDSAIYKPIMINMTVTRAVLNSDGTAAEPVESAFNLPLLTIIPLNSLAVDEINVSFEMEVKSSFSSDTSSSRDVDKDNSSLVKKIDAGSHSVEITGSVGVTDKSNSTDNTSYKKSNSAKYEISTHAGQLPLPVGVASIIEAYSQAIAPIHLKAGDASS